MYVDENDIVHGDKPLKKVIFVKPFKDRTMLLLFSDGEKRLFDMKTVEGPVFEPLKNDDVFMNPVVQYNTVTWADGTIDIAPETLYFEGKKIE